MDKPAATAFKTKLSQRVCIGILSECDDRTLLEKRGHSGFDFIVLNKAPPSHWLEVLTSLPPVIALTQFNTQRITQALYQGAAGVHITDICTASQAETVVQQVSFYALSPPTPPCNTVARQAYCQELTPTHRRLIILQIASLDGIRNLDAILDIKGFDVLFIDLYALSKILGISGNFNTPTVLNFMADIIEKTHRRGIFLGSFSDSIVTNIYLRQQGFHYIVYTADSNLYSSTCIQLIGH